MLVETETNQGQLRKILQSKALRTSEVHRNLLNYLAEKSLSGEADSLKEYTVGLDVFAKPDTYDPRQESVVRMHMARLRQKLAEYYRTEGLSDPIIIDLPKGAFKVTFEPRAAVMLSETAGQPDIADSAASGTNKRTLILLLALLIAAVACASYFGVRLLQVERSTAGLTPAFAWTPELRDLWTSLLSQDRPLVVVLATQQSGNVTGVANANGAFLLGQFLADRKQNVYLTSSNDLSMPDIVMGNLVFLGAPSDNRQRQALPSTEELVLEATGIRNLHPAEGEAALYPNPPPRSASSTVDQSYALITRAPGVNGKGDVLYLSGTNAFSPAAGVMAFTDASIARGLVARMRKADGKLPRYYQVLLTVKSMDDTPIEISYLMHKELAGPGR